MRQTLALKDGRLRNRPAKVICRRRIFVTVSVICESILTSNFYSVFMILPTSGRFYLLKNYMRVTAVIRFFFFFIKMTRKKMIIFVVRVARTLLTWNWQTGAKFG